MSKRSRDRHLAKLAARRQAERDAQRRRRQRTLGTVATASPAVVLLVVAGLVIFNGGDDTGEPVADREPDRQSQREPEQPHAAGQAGDADRHGRPAAGARRGRVRRRSAEDGRQAQAAVLRAAAHEDRSREDVHRHDGDLVRHDRDRAGSEDRAADREQLRVPGQPRLLRRAVLHPDRHLDRRPAGRRSHGHRNAAARATRSPTSCRAASSTRRACSPWRTPAPNTGGSQFFIITGDNGHNLDSNPNYTIFGNVIERTRCGATDPEAPDQGPGRRRAGRHQRSGAEAGRLLRLGDDHREA